MTRKQKRLTVVAGGMGFIAAAVLLVLSALSSDITFFRTPSELVAGRPGPSTRLRLGGLVAPGTVVRGKGTEVSFDVTDRKHSVRVVYDGILPDLFRAGQGVVAEGSFPAGGDTFVADTVLARHDEKYMPREVADELKKNGEWYGDTQAAAKPAGPRTAER